MANTLINLLDSAANGINPMVFGGIIIGLTIVGIKTVLFGGQAYGRI
jgi:hypothetical protein